MSQWLTVGTSPKPLFTKLKKSQNAPELAPSVQTLPTTNQVPEPQQAGRNCVRAFFVLFVIVFVSLFCYFPTHRHLYTHKHKNVTVFSSVVYFCFRFFSLFYCRLLLFVLLIIVYFIVVLLFLVLFSFLFGTCIDFVFFGVSIFWHLDSVRQTDLVSLRSVRAACLRLVFFSFFLVFFVKHLHITHTIIHTRKFWLTDRKNCEESFDKLWVLRATFVIFFYWEFVFFSLLFLFLFFFAFGRYFLRFISTVFIWFFHNIIQSLPFWMCEFSALLWLCSLPGVALRLLHVKTELINFYFFFPSAESPSRTFMERPTWERPPDRAGPPPPQPPDWCQFLPPSCHMPRRSRPPPASFMSTR